MMNQNEAMTQKSFIVLFPDCRVAVGRHGRGHSAFVGGRWGHGRALEVDILKKLSSSWHKELSHFFTSYTFALFKSKFYLKRLFASWMVTNKFHCELVFYSISENHLPSCPMLFRVWGHFEVENLIFSSLPIPTKFRARERKKVFFRRPWRSAHTTKKQKLWNIFFLQILLQNCIDYSMDYCLLLAAAVVVTVVAQQVSEWDGSNCRELQFVCFFVSSFARSVDKQKQKQQQLVAQLIQIWQKLTHNFLSLSLSYFESPKICQMLSLTKKCASLTSTSFLFPKRRPTLYQRRR